MWHGWIRLAPGALGALMAAWPLGAQQPTIPGGERDAYVRLLELQGGVTGAPITFHSLSANRSIRLLPDSADLWRLAADRSPLTARRSPLTILPAELRVVYTSDYPRVANDGAVWAGKGLTASLTGGGELRWRFLTATLLPTLYYAQNRAFPLASVPWTDRSPYAYQWQHNIDWPQRMGPDALTEFDWGQSGIRADWGAWTLGFSTENQWWGPGVRNAILMSNAGPGFPHLDLGTGHPVRTAIGEVEARVLWGGLSQSRYFDTTGAGGRRFLTGLTLGYRPRFLPGLDLGISRVLYRHWPTAGLSASDLVDVLGGFFNQGTPTPSGALVNDSTDQMLSVSARWVLPASGFAVYAEWARGDFNADLRDLLVEPDHSRGYTLGFEKVLPSGEGRLRLTGETTTLGRSSTFLERASPVFYQHDLVHQGYTQRGQLLGAAIGPGGQSQFLGLDRYTRGGRWGVFLQRIRFDDDAYYRIFAGQQIFANHQVELTAGGSLYRFLGSVELGGGLSISRELNRYFQLYNDLTNLTLHLSLRWRDR